MRPTMHKVTWRQGCDENNLEQQVDHRANDLRKNNCPRNIAVGIAGLPSEFNSLLKTDQGEHYSGRQGFENSFDAEGSKSTTCTKIAWMERSNAQRDDSEQRNSNLPPDCCRIGL